MQKVMVFGTFDILHPGHTYMLTMAKNLGDHLTVIIGRDQTVEKIKGHKPQFDEITRLKNVENLGIAQKVRLGNSGPDKYQVIREEQPHIIALGYDQQAFVDELRESIDHTITIVRLAAYKPELYKSSKIKKQMDK